jgi:hypothetical protein
MDFGRFFLLPKSKNQKMPKIKIFPEVTSGHGGYLLVGIGPYYHAIEFGAPKYLATQ